METAAIVPQVSTVKGKFMKVAYFDCSYGISGNMVLGALIDAGLPKSFLLSVLKKLKIDNCKIDFIRIRKGGISATLVDVKITKPEKPRTLKEILAILNSSKLGPSIKNKAKEIFTRLARAESKVHGVSMGKLHFHELGATDAIIDIAGSVAGLEKLGIKKIYSSPLNVGRGRVKTAHGVFSVPAPATRELLRGFPVYSNKLTGELVTPTGAAIITTLADVFGDAPRIRFNRLASGAGSYPSRVPNTLCVIIGDAEEIFECDRIFQIETNIDDMNPQFYEHVIDRLLASGALDVFVTPTTMKKRRPAAILTALSPVDKKDKVIKAILSETTSIGVRTYLVPRYKLKREVSEIKTRYGNIRVKLGLVSGRVLNASPEFKDCRRLSRLKNVPLKTIYSEANKVLSERLGGRAT